MEVNMNEQGIMHVPDSKYCFPRGEHSLAIRLRLDRRDIIEKVEVIYECKYEIHEKQQSVCMERCYEDKLFAYYETQLLLSDVRLAYVFRIWENGKGYYFSEDGLSETYDFTLGYFNFFQLPYINKADIHEEVDWLREAVFYEIFVDRFCIGKKEKDKSYINMEWGGRPTPKSFAGGDLPGITMRLDYIRELGANALYLTPIFRAVSNHKYDISDYYMVDEHFGTNEDFGRLVEEAHRQGMRVVLDAVFNHCSEFLPQFQDVIRRGKESPYFDWFIIDGDKPDRDHLNYEVFSVCAYMPKFNTSNKEVQDFLLDIAISWIRKYDIDGWRLDVSDEISHDFWRTFRKRVKETKKDCVIIGENWHDANSFLRGDQYDSIMNYAFTKACLDYYAFEDFGAQEFAWKLNELLMRNTGQVNAMMMNLLDSHDTDRFYTSVNCNKDKVLSAMAVMCMFTGAPCIYYGTEIPLEGGYDPDNRRCFDWNRENWDEDFMKQIKQLLVLRRQKTVQRGGIRITSRGKLFYLSRWLGEEELLLVANESNEAEELNLTGEILAANLLQVRGEARQGKISGNMKKDGFAIIKRKKDVCVL